MRTPRPTIVAVGGLRPHAAAVHPILDYVLNLCGVARPRVCFLPTASGDALEAIVTFHDRFPAVRCEPTYVSLFRRTIDDLRAHLLAQDVIFVGGGNTANLLAVWRAHGLDAILREAWETGIVLAGGSAGSLCWFECGTTDSFNLDRLAPLHDGLGFLPGSHCPHYDGEVQRRPLYHALIADGFPEGYAVDDDAAIRFDGTSPAEVVSARGGATAYHVARAEDEVVETPLRARLLG
ncbi:MAG: peptidase E [Actinomycetota bacterium]